MKLYVNTSSVSPVNSLITAVDDANPLQNPVFVLNDKLPLELYFCDGQQNYTAWSADLTYSTKLAIVSAGTVILAADGSDEEPGGLPMSISGTVTAGNNTDTNAISIRPKELFYNFRNNSKLEMYSVDILVTGSNPVQYKLAIGQTLTGDTSYTSVGNVSGFEYNTAGVADGAPFLAVESGYVNASNQAKGTVARPVLQRIPITLNAAGTARLNGTLTLLVKGIGGASAVNYTLNWREIR